MLVLVSFARGRQFMDHSDHMCSTVVRPGPSMGVCRVKFYRDGVLCDDFSLFNVMFPRTAELVGRGNSGIVSTSLEHPARVFREHWPRVLRRRGTDGQLRQAWLAYDGFHATPEQLCHVPGKIVPFD